MAASRLLNGVCLVLLALGLAGCGGSSSTGGGGGGGSPLPKAAVVIKVDFDANNSGKYDPTPAMAKVGDVVEWDFNDDQAAHTASSDDSSTFDSGNKNKGEKYQFTFTKAGTFKYHCTIHANMHGTITVQ
jgi:plastocyanin